MADEKQERLGRVLYDWTQALVCSVLALVLVFTFAVRMVRVDGPSMRETLQDGDLLVTVNRLLSGDPQAGDIVIIRKDSFEDGEPIVKRVIATGGQTVDIDFQTGTVTVDGAVLDEPYIREDTYLDEGMTFPLTVPEGSIFVMGDNRNNSNDSRNPELGTVDVRYVIGQAVLLAVPGKTVDTDQRELGRIGTLT